MDTPQSKRGLLIGAFVFAFLVFAVGVGMLVFSRTTDNRSQAAAAPVAAIRTVYQREVTGTFAHLVMVDISQMKPGTTVTDFSAQLFVAAKEFVPPESATPLPRPSGSISVFPTQYPKPSAMATPYPMPSGKETYPPRPVTQYPTGLERAVTGQPVPEASESVLGVSTTAVPAPETAVLAQSKDGNLRVKGMGKYAQLQNLSVAVNTVAGGYSIAISGQAASKDTLLQQAFMQPEAILAITGNEKAAALANPVVQSASVRGYLPGVQAIVELTRQEVKPPTPTVRPTDKPPLVVKACRTTKECPQGYTCMPPKAPTCAPGKLCAQRFYSWQCTLTAPTPTPVRRPPVMPTKSPVLTKPPMPSTENPRVIIRTIQ